MLAGLWRTTFGRGRGYVLADVEQALDAVAGAAAVRFLHELIDDRLEPPLETLLAAFALRMQWREQDRPCLGLQFETGSTAVASVVAGSPAADGGIHPGDEILSLQGLRVDAGRWADVLAAAGKGGGPIDVLLSRRGVIATCRVQPRASPGTLAIEVDPAADAPAKALLDAWVPDRKATGAKPLITG